MTERKQKVFRYTVSIKWPHATPPLDAVMDMLRYCSAAVESFGQDQKTGLFWMNLEFRYTDTVIENYRHITFARFASFGFSTDEGKRFVLRGDGPSLEEWS